MNAHVLPVTCCAEKYKNWPYECLRLLGLWTLWLEDRRREDSRRMCSSFAGLLSSRKKVPIWLLYCLLVIQFSYIVIDFFAYHQDPLVLACRGNCPASSQELFKVGDEFEGKSRHCQSKEEHYEESKRSTIKSDDPWQQMKWVGQPAICSVNGYLIEKLDDSYNFRRGFSLKFVETVEDKTHILPWLLASKVDLNRRKRRVYLDLGANLFNTSVLWFLRMYPCDFTEVHAFESNRSSWRAPNVAFNEGANIVRSSNRSISVKQTPEVPEWMLNRIRIHYQFVADQDDEKKGFINITRFMKEELNLTASDTVVVKMDIEGSEWPILNRWVEDPEMPLIIDELFVELHYAHPSMSSFGWDNFPQFSREDAKRLLADLRWRGFYAHAWP